MSNVAPSLFDGIEQARPGVGGVYISPGVYLFKVLACKIGMTRNKIAFFVAELETLESSNSERPVGGKQSYWVGADKDAFLSNVRGFVAAAMNSAFDDVDREAVDLVVSEHNPLAGNIVRCTANNITTKAGKPFTRCEFTPYTRTA